MTMLRPKRSGTLRFVTDQHAGLATGTIGLASVVPARMTRGVDRRQWRRVRGDGVRGLR